MIFDWKKLRKFRKRQFLTVRKLADKAGINKDTIYRLENWLIEEPHFATIEVLATALKVDKADFYSFQEYLIEV